MVVLGIDQSYSNFGYSVYDGENLLEYGSLDLRKLDGRRVKRWRIRQLMDDLIRQNIPKYEYRDIDRIVVEQIRLFNAKFAKLDNIVQLAELISTIVDKSRGIPVYTVDSRSWKSKVLGKSNGDKKDSVAFVKERFGIDVDHDTADAICISMVSFCEKPVLNLYE